MTRRFLEMASSGFNMARRGEAWPGDRLDSLHTNPRGHMAGEYHAPHVTHSSMSHSCGIPNRHPHFPMPSRCLLGTFSGPSRGLLGAFSEPCRGLPRRATPRKRAFRVASSRFRTIARCGPNRWQYDTTTPVMGNIDGVTPALNI